MVASGSWIAGTIKAVLSGDSLVLVGRAQSGGIPPERTVSLAGVAAPRLGRRDAAGVQGRDEPFAAQSREALRLLAIGKEVTFRIENVAGGGSREQATVFVGRCGLCNSTCASTADALCSRSENLALSVLTAGWARARERVPEVLTQAQSVAQAAHAGMWSLDPPPASPPLVAAEPASLAVGVALEALVEGVLNGGTLRVTRLGRHSGSFATCSLAGVQCPSLGREAGAPEAFAREARAHTESRVLHRVVAVTPRGVDKFGTLVASVRDGEGRDVAEELLSLGLGRVAEWGLALAPCDAPRLRAAENGAVKERRGVWHAHAPAQPTLAPGQRYSARVVEAVSGDVLLVAHDASGAERRLSLASVRAPRLGNARKGEPPQPWAAQAKELLRAQLVGRSVGVELEYARTVAQGDGGADGERTLQFATILEERLGADGAVLARRSVAELLVAQGLALAVRHRPGEERAGRYDALLAAEEAARAARRGMHSGGEPPAAAHPAQDVSRDAARAFLPALLRCGRTPAVVDFVVSAGRLKLLVAREGLLLLFSLAGVRCPRPPEKGADQAVAFLRTHITQRTVDVQLEELEKAGVFTGSLFYASSPGGARDTALADAMVHAGLARVMRSNDGRAAGRGLRALEAAAREAGRGLWEGWVEEASAEEEPQVSPPESMGVTVTDVRSGALFHLQRRDDEALQALEAGLQRLAECEGDAPGAPPSGPAFSPAPGALCRARFSVDERWYRARVLRCADGQAEVLYVDYGNTEALAVSRLAPLDAALAAQPPLALPACLAYLQVPPLEQECGPEAAALLSSLTGGGRQMTACVEARDRATGLLHVTLSPEEGDEGSVASHLLREGLARIQRTGGARAREAVAALQEHQEHARSRRLGLFEYGEAFDSDDDRS